MEKILLIDGDSLIYYEAHRNDVFEALDGIKDRMNRIFNDCNSTTYKLFLTEGKCFRYDRAVTKPYKEFRKDRDKPLFFNTIKGYLKDVYNAVSIDNIEADDCVSYLKITNPSNTIICSPDKDVLQQVPGNHYNYQMISVNNTYKSKGFVNTSVEDARNFLYVQLLMGDSTDGISGIEGIGIKKAEKILQGHLFEEGVVNPLSAIQDEYIKVYGSMEGTHRFFETFKLVYLLKKPVDFIRENLTDAKKKLDESKSFKFEISNEVNNDEW